jgi:hypothetical protein
MTGRGCRRASLSRPCAASQAVASYHQMWKAFDKTLEQIGQLVQAMQADEHNGLNSTQLN